MKSKKSALVKKGKIFSTTDSSHERELLPNEIPLSASELALIRACDGDLDKAKNIIRNIETVLGLAAAMEGFSDRYAKEIELERGDNFRFWHEHKNSFEQEYRARVCERDAAWSAYCQCPTILTYTRYDDACKAVKSWRQCCAVALRSASAFL